MPIVEIHATAIPASGSESEMLRSTCVDGAAALKCDPTNVWTLFHEVSPARYFCGSEPSPKVPAKSHPPLVFIRLLSGRSRELKTGFAQAVSRAVAKAYGLTPEVIWIHFMEMEKAEVYANGVWTDQAG